MPTVLREQGFEVRIYTLDHPPPHVHVAKAGANIISFHPEASDHIDRTIGLIKDSGCKAGLVLNPATPLVYLDHVLEKLDLVLTRAEVRTVLRQLRGTPRLMAILMYGSGLRLLECARLRVQDVDFERHQITVRDGKGDKDRTTTLPSIISAELTRHLEAAKKQHDVDLR